MATARPQEVIEDVADFLQDNIEDPNKDRRGSSSRFVYTIPINFDLSQFPRIHLQEIDSVDNGFSIGSTSRESNVLFQVSIFHGTSSGNKLDVDNDGEKESVNNIVDFLTQRVIDLINDNQSRWQGLGSNVHYIKLVNTNVVENEDNSVIRKTLDFELRLTR